MKRSFHLLKISEKHPFDFSIRFINLLNPFWNGLEQHNITTVRLPSVKTMKMYKTCWMYLIHKLLKRDPVVMVIGQMSCHIMTMKWMKRIGELIPIVIWSAAKMRVMLWYIAAEMETKKGSNK